MRTAWNRIFGLAPLAMLAGCAVGPDFVRPDAPQASGYTAQPLPAQTASSKDAAGKPQAFAPGRDIPAQWWTLFHCEPLSALIVQALKANPDLQSAQAALRVATENVYAQEGAYYPSVAANFTPSRYHNAVQPSPTLANFVPYFNLYSAQISAAWTLDIWGGNRREVESLQATADAERFQLDAAYLTLTSALVAAAVQEASLRAQISATEDIVRIETQSLGILQRQKSLGQVAGSDVAAQEAALALAQETLPPLQKQLAQQRDLITALAGRLPSEEVSQTFELSNMELPQELPLTLPSKLVEQRPDIRAAEENLHAASAQIGVAIANMLPNITLSATDGTTATKLSQLFQPMNGYWTLAGGVTQPIFEGGTLLHKTRAARAAYDQATAQYRSTVITAFQNVADTLHAIQSDADALKAAVAAGQAASASLGYAQKQLQLGAISYLGLLNAQQAYQQAVISLAQARANRFADTAALFQALGGGWWNLKDADPAVPAVAED